jgi:DNA-binding PadR family transcriptional regulator
VPIQHAVLALLADAPAHGYQLKGDFEAAVGPQWGGLNIGHLYQVLERLSRDGLVSSHVEAQGQRPDRVVYALTDAGRAELDRWLELPAERAGGYRDDFFLKLVAASRHGRDATSGVLSRQRAHEYARLRALGELARHEHEPIVALLVEAARRHAEADLAVVDLAEERLDDLVAPAPASHDARDAERPAGNPPAAYGIGTG